MMYTDIHTLVRLSEKLRAHEAFAEKAGIQVVTILKSEKEEEKRSTGGTLKYGERKENV